MSPDPVMIDLARYEDCLSKQDALDEKAESIRDEAGSLLDDALGLLRVAQELSEDPQTTALIKAIEEWL